MSCSTEEVQKYDYLVVKKDIKEKNMHRIACLKTVFIRIILIHLVSRFIAQKV